MPKITVAQGKMGCPYCGAKATIRQPRLLVDPSTGRKDKFGGYFFRCNCTSLTKSPRGKYNLTNPHI